MTRLRITLISVMLFAAAPWAAAQEFITIGTGSATGVYYPAGGAICRLVNDGRQDHGVRCFVETTGGSIYNLNTLRAGGLEFGVVQSDWQYHALHGTSLFTDAGAFDDLRAVFALHPEPVTIVARADSGIARLEDLRGKRVNIGNPGSGQRGTMEVLMAALGWTLEDFSKVSELRASEQAFALCNNDVDAMVFVAGHPSASIEAATTLCEAVLVDVSGPVVDRLVEENAFYRHAVIPGGLYAGNDADVATFGVGASLVTSAAVDEDVVLVLVSAVFDELDRFRRMHPAFADLTPESMATAGLSAPLHDGALRYYRAHGLVD